MPIESNHPLAWFKDELYYIPEQRHDKYVKNPRTGARFIVPRRVRNLAPWRITYNGYNLEDARCKKILLCDYLFAPSFYMQQNRLHLLHDLVQEGFEISVFTNSNTIARLDPKKIQDVNYLRTIFKQTQFFHPKAQSQKMHQAIAQLKLQGKANPENEWCFLDSYTVEKILYSYKHADSNKDPTHFCYNLDLDLNRSDGFTTKNPQFSSFLEAIPKEKIETLRFNDEFKASDISTYTQLKSIAITDYTKDLNFLEQAPCHTKIEHLDFSYCEYLPDFTKFPALKTLSLKSYTNKLQKLPTLPDTLEMIKINYGMNLADLSALKFTKLKHLKMDMLHSPIKQLDFLPSSLEEITTIGKIDLSQLKNYPKLKKLNLNYGFHDLPLEHLHNVEEIIITNSVLTQLPDLKQHSKLKTLKLRSIRGLRELPSLPDTLEEINIANCPSLKELPDFSQFPKLRKLTLEANQLKLPLPSSLEELTLDDYCGSDRPLDLSALSNLKKLTIDAKDLSKFPCHPI